MSNSLGHNHIVLVDIIYPTIWSYTYSLICFADNVVEQLPYLKFF